MAEDEETQNEGTQGAAPGADAPGAGEQMSEEEMRAAYEEQIKQVRIQDLILQSAVSILQLSARRIAKEDERDLDQARAGIDAAAALIDHTPEEAHAELRQAVSELKLLFAQHSGEGAPEAPPKDGEKEPGNAEEPPKKPGDSGLWTPGAG